MAALRRGSLVIGTVVVLLFVGSGAAHAEDAALSRWRDLVAAASRKFEIPESWITSVMRAESAGEDTVEGRPIISPAGAMGLMQIMPDTWGGLRSRYGFGKDPYDPHDNIFAGAAYLRELYQRYGYPKLFAAYNAGPGRLDAYLLGNSPLPDETQNYLITLGAASGGWQIPPARNEGRLFFDLGAPARESPMPASGGLFVVLRTSATLP